MATRWYTAYRVNPDLLKILITALGINIKTINEDGLIYYSKNGFKSLEDLLDKVILSGDEIINKLIKELRNREIPINSATFVEAFNKYIDFVDGIRGNELIYELNKLIQRLCSIETLDLKNILFQTTYANLISTLLSQVMCLKVIDEQTDNKLLEFERMQTIITGLTNTLLEISQDDILFLSECKQNMDIPDDGIQHEILKKLTERFNFMGDFLYLIIATEKLDEINADKIFVEKSCVIDTNKLSDLANKLTTELSSTSRTTAFKPEELFLKFFLSKSIPELQTICNKSVGNHGKIPEGYSYFEACYHTLIKKNH